MTEAFARHKLLGLRSLVAYCAWLVVSCNCGMFLVADHPDLKFIEDDRSWAPWAEFSARTLEDGARALAYAGLFTDYLSQLNQGAVAVELIRQGLIDETDSGSFTKRDVILTVGTRTAAVASTLIAPKVLAQYPWLHELGGRAIGETLESRLGAVRTDISYRRIDNGSALANHFDSAERVFWGRRYRYEFDGGELLITEVIAGSIMIEIERSNHKG